ncbi:MAG: endonuclease/exonuclease/phosphatase family protein [Deltaproteobacteria bacterium]|nr:endonuclease/exonuclease/phosphatase family protein [Deltaproteobacteria bacterium]
MKLKLITININGYGEKFGPWSVRRKFLREIIEREDPQLVALQAVSSDTRRFSGRDQAHQLADELMVYSSVTFEAATVIAGERQLGVALLSKLRPLQIERLRLDTSSRDEDPSQRVILRAAFQLGSTKLQLFNCHFSWGAEQNKRNLEQALQFFSRFEDPSIVVGDFNASPESSGIELLLRNGWIDSWAHLKPGQNGFTFESDRPTQRIDYVMVSNQLASALQRIGLLPSASRRESVSYSDHLGLIAELIII